MEYEIGSYRMRYFELFGRISDKRCLIKVLYKNDLLYERACSYYVANTLWDQVKFYLVQLNETPFTELPLMVNGVALLRVLVMRRLELGV